MNLTKNKIRILAFMAVLAMFSVSCYSAEFFLRADTTTMTMPDGKAVLMWGFALDSAFNANDGVVTVPGPMLTVPAGDSNLTIHLQNKLTEPVSIMINGQVTAMTPVRNPDGRIRSFTHETLPGNAAPVDYVWTNFQPGSYIYQSGSHPAVQVQMGLYGGAKKDYAQGAAYQGVAYDEEATLFFSEIDPALHDAIQNDEYGVGKSMTSTMGYVAKYFLLNGKPYTAGLPAIPSGKDTQKILLRCFNASLESRTPILNNLYANVVAEDGKLYPYAAQQYSIQLSAGKTKDAVITPAKPGKYPVYDRQMGLSNGTAGSGGMFNYLAVGCLSDINGDTNVNNVDLAILGSEFGRTNCSVGDPCQADLNGDGSVNTADLALMMGTWLSDCP